MLRPHGIRFYAHSTEVPKRGSQLLFHRVWGDQSSCHSNRAKQGSYISFKTNEHIHFKFVLVNLQRSYHELFVEGPVVHYVNITFLRDSAVDISTSSMVGSVPDLLGAGVNTRCYCIQWRWRISIFSVCRSIPTWLNMQFKGSFTLCFFGKKVLQIIYTGVRYWG